MYSVFANESLHIDDIVVYLKNERTGSSTVRKCKFVGQIIGFTKTKVEIHRFSQPDTFVTPDKIQDLGVDIICPDDVVHIIISKYQEDSNTRLLSELNNIISKQNQDIKLLIGRWFLALEDEGVEPWEAEECLEMANRYHYTEEDYREHLSTIC
jgi:hypothetical protein